MKPTVTILVCVLAAGLASAQNPRIIQDTRATMNSVSNHETAASNQALGISQSTRRAPVAPPRSSSPSLSVHATTHPMHARHHEGPRKHLGAVAVVGGTAAQPAVMLPKDNPPAEAGNGVQETAEGETASEDQVVPDSKYAANGRRDPFLSPVVNHTSGSGCNTGKKCLEIGAINLRGVVHSDSGFIAVVSNGLNKAYFLRENDPVFNGYVVKITGDSIVFQETLQDRLGKSFTREVIKKITTPAV
ncbi:MAG: hypothetical protein WBW53_02260 [Terriglobales bacterium]